jgi:hypothetical protein
MINANILPAYAWRIGIFPTGDPRISYLAGRCYVVISRVFPGCSQDTPQSRVRAYPVPQSLISPCALSSLGLRFHRPGFSASYQGNQPRPGRRQGSGSASPSHCAHSNRAISGWCLADTLFIVCLLWSCQAASTRGIRKGTHLKPSFILHKTPFYALIHSFSE